MYSFFVSSLARSAFCLYPPPSWWRLLRIPSRPSTLSAILNRIFKSFGRSVYCCKLFPTLVSPLCTLFDLGRHAGDSIPHVPRPSLRAISFNMLVLSSMRPRPLRLRGLVALDPYGKPQHVLQISYHHGLGPFSPSPSTLIPFSSWSDLLSSLQSSPLSPNY